MQLIIPKKNDSSPYTRKEMELFLRENILSKNHMILRHFAIKEPWKLHPDFYISAPINLIIHWLLDRMIDEALKKDTIKVVGEKMGLAPARTAEHYKIKGYDPRGGNDEFMLEYTKLLAQFIQRKMAIMPGENEGVKLDLLERYIEPDTNSYSPPPPPPGVSSLEVINMIPNPSYAQFPSMNAMEPPNLAMPPTPTRKTRSTVKPKLAPPVNEINSISAQGLSKSLKARDEYVDERILKLEDAINALDTRMSFIESKLKQLRGDK